MSEISIQTRNVNRFSEILIYTGVGAGGGTLFMLPETWPLFLFFAGCLATGTLMYFRSPKKKLVIFGVEGQRLTYTSLADPVVGIGRKYEDSIVVDINELELVSMASKYIYRVGYFLHIEMQERKGINHVIWMDEHCHPDACRILHKILDSNPAIRILAVGRGTECDFSNYASRIIHEKQDYTERKPWKNEISKRGKFSDNEWRQILLVPVIIFYMVAKADGEVQKSEVSVFVTTLRQAEQYNSFFVAEVFAGVLELFDTLVDMYRSKDRQDRVYIESVLQILDNRIDEADQHAFRQALLALANEISHVRKQKSQWSSHQEKYVLQKINRLLANDEG